MALIFLNSGLQKIATALNYIDSENVIPLLGEKKKYKARILKYVPCILKFLGPNFSLLLTGYKNSLQAAGLQL